jgi:hypothetical protein
MDDRPGRPGLVAGLRWVLRWRAHSHLHAWLVAAAGYLAEAGVLWLIGDWPRHGVTSFMVLAAPWLGVAGGQSYDLQRRKNGGQVSDAKPFGRLPRSR